MSNVERRILRRMKELAGVDPSPQASDRAIAAARAAVAERLRSGPIHQARRFTMLRRHAKAAFGLAAAASILVAAGILFLLPHGRVNAAEILRQAATTSASYKGWVHMQYDLKGGQEMPADFSFQSHIRTTDGTWVQVARKDGVLTVTWMSPTTREYSSYNGQTNQLAVGQMAPETAQGLRDQLALIPVSADDVFKHLQKAASAAPEVKVSQDDGCERLDIHLAEPLPNSQGERDITVWVDPQTQRIRAIQTQIKAGTVRVEFTYGAPEITSIYDVGVPRDAKVVQNGARDTAAPVLDRLEQRSKDFGDYVALVTETPLEDDGTPDPQMSAIRLYAQNGQAWLWCRWLVGKRSYGPGQPRQAIDVPAGWPAPDLQTTLGLIRNAKPGEYLVDDGQVAWNRFQGEMRGTSRAQMVPAAKSMMGLNLWPSRQSLNLFGPDAKAEVITFPDAPGQIDLHVEMYTQMRDGSKQRIEQDFWLDTARSDVPLRSLTRNWSADGKSIEVQGEVLSQACAQTPNGTWYSTRWRQATWMLGGPKRTTSMREFHLQMVPGMRLDPAWFTNPKEWGAATSQPAPTAP